MSSSNFLFWLDKITGTASTMHTICSVQMQKKLKKIIQICCTGSLVARGGRAFKASCTFSGVKYAKPLVSFFKPRKYVFSSIYGRHFHQVGLLPLLIEIDVAGRSHDTRDLTMSSFPFPCATSLLFLCSQSDLAIGTLCTIV